MASPFRLQARRGQREGIPDCQVHANAMASMAGCLLPAVFQETQHLILGPAESNPKEVSAFFSLPACKLCIIHAHPHDVTAHDLYLSIRMTDCKVWRESRLKVSTINT